MARSREWRRLDVYILGVGHDGRRRSLFFPYVPLSKGRQLYEYWVAWVRRRWLRGFFFLKVAGQVRYSGRTLPVERLRDFLP